MINRICRSKKLERDNYEFLTKKEELHAADNISVFIITDLFVMSLVVLLTNYMTIQKWDKKQLRNANMLDHRIYQPSYRGKKQYAFKIGTVTRE